MAAIISGPGKLDWEVYAGDANEETFEFAKGDDPWDLTGATLRAQARKTASDPAAALTAVCAVDTEGGLGRATVAWDGEAVRALLGADDTWVGQWDLEVLEAGATLPTTVLRGALTAVLDVTKTDGPPPLTLDHTETELAVGGQFDLMATLADPRPVTWAWTSSSASVVTVQDMGGGAARVTAVGAGIADVEVVATPLTGGPMSASCVFTVIDI